MLDVPVELYQNATSPVSDLLKVYVYDLLEKEHSSNSNTNSNLNSNTSNSSLPFDFTRDVFEWFVRERYDSNWITDVPLIRLFQSFPGRVMDPAQADIFVVPYPHAGHCMKGPGYQLKCTQLDDNVNVNINANANATKTKTTKDIVLNSLPYYNESTADRHLFFLSDFEMIGQPWIASQPLLVTYGPRWDHPSGTLRRKHPVYRSPPGHILVPQFNANLQFQPSFVETRFGVQVQQQHHAQNLSRVENNNNS